MSVTSSDSLTVQPQTVTSWLPLTTVYPYKPGCESAFFLSEHATSPVAWDPGVDYYASASLSCLPQEILSWRERTISRLSWGRIETGIQPIVCPAAYTTASTSMVQSSSALVFCCPSEYTLETLGKPGCRSAMTSGQTFSALSKNSDDTWLPKRYVATTEISMLAWPIMGYNIVDLEALPPPLTSDSTQKLPTPYSPRPASTSSPLQTSNSTPTSNAHQPKALSTGAYIGIGVSAAVGLVLILCILIWILRRRRKARFGHRIQSSVELSAEKANGVSEYHDPPATELPYRPVHEIAES